MKLTLADVEKVLRGVEGQIKQLKGSGFSDEKLKAFGADLEDRIMKAVLAKVPTGEMHPLGGQKDDIAKRKELNKMTRFMLTRDSRTADGEEMKAMGLTTGAAGGYFVPEEFIAEVQRKLVRRVIFRNIARVFTGVGRKGVLPRETGTVDVTWSGENVTNTENTNPTLGNLAWSLSKMLVLQKISNELVNESEVDVMDIVTDMISEQIAIAEETAFMNGSGSGRPTGLRALAGVGSRNQSTANLVYNDFVDLKHDLLSQYRQNATWLMENTILALTAKVKDSTGLPIFLNMGAMGGKGVTDTVPVNTVGWILGSPVMEQNDIPTNLGGSSDESEIWYGDMKKAYAIFDGGSMELASTSEGFTTFETDQIAVRATKLVDGKGNIAEAVKKLAQVA
jgi:HK97 family phage major capsid protein